MPTPAKKVIAAFSGNRAEYGLLYPVLKAIHEHPALELQLYVGGDHTRLGTVSEIEADGLPVFQTLSYDQPLSESSASELACQATADILPKMQRFFSQNPADAFFVLGDRYESFAAVLAAFYRNIPIIHLGGGDTTEGGCADDTLRFLVSDTAHIHFAISKLSADRLLQRGEEPWRVHVSGSPVIDNIANTTLVDKKTLCKQFGVDEKNPIVLFTQHPIPAEGIETITHFEESLTALANLGETHQVQVIATCPNQDGFGDAFTKVVERSKKEHPNIRWQTSLGRVNYLSWMNACDVVVGNSSSGLIETPFFKKPSVSVGPRQEGRMRADNTIACAYGVDSVQKAVLSALYDLEVKACIENLDNPFGDKPCAPYICSILANLPEKEILLRKKLFSKSSSQPLKSVSI